MARGTRALHKSRHRASVYDSALVHRGQLHKRSSGPLRRWQPRMFEIRGHYLTYAYDNVAKSAGAGGSGGGAEGRERVVSVMKSRRMTSDGREQMDAEGQTRMHGRRRTQSSRALA